GRDGELARRTLERVVRAAQEAHAAPRVGQLRLVALDLARRLLVRRGVTHLAHLHVTLRARVAARLLIALELAPAQDELCDRVLAVRGLVGDRVGRAVGQPLADLDDGHVPVDRRARRQLSPRLELGDAGLAPRVLRAGRYRVDPEPHVRCGRG